MNRRNGGKAERVYKTEKEEGKHVWLDHYLTWIGNPEPIRLFQHSCSCVSPSLISGTFRIRRKPTCHCDDSTNDPRSGDSEDDLQEKRKNKIRKLILYE